MGHPAGHPEIENTIMQNKRLIQEADDEARRLRAARRRSTRVL
jgi:hypothetical protein